MGRKIFNILTTPFAVISIILIIVSLQWVNGNLSYFFGLFMAFVFLWSSKFSWSEFGFSKVPWLKTILKVLLYAALIFIVIDVCIQPFIEIYLGAIDLSSMDYLRGSLPNYLIFMAIMWVMAAFGEEFLYRGFLMKRLATILGDTNKSWLISAIVISVIFGMAHNYQGFSGMITTGLVGFCFALIFYKNRNNLTVGILTHGFYDMIGITLIYFNHERIIVDWVQQLLQR